MKLVEDGTAGIILDEGEAYFVIEILKDIKNKNYDLSEFISFADRFIKKWNELCDYGYRRHN